eukprot:8779634-Pyramimonas_sp.AAC.1
MAPISSEGNASPVTVAPAGSNEAPGHQGDPQDSNMGTNNIEAPRVPTPAPDSSTHPTPAPTPAIADTVAQVAAGPPAPPPGLGPPTQAAGARPRPRLVWAPGPVTRLIPVPEHE